jgi:hypothetical protein
MNDETCKDCAWFDDVSEECTNTDIIQIHMDCDRAACDLFEPIKN